MWRAIFFLFAYQAMELLCSYWYVGCSSYWDQRMCEQGWKCKASIIMYLMCCGWLEQLGQYGIMTWCGLDFWGTESQWEWDFLCLLWMAMRPTQLSVQHVQGLSCGCRKWGRVLRLRLLCCCSLCQIWLTVLSSTSLGVSCRGSLMLHIRNKWTFTWTVLHILS
jgi:hypothetical protein